MKLKKLLPAILAALSVTALGVTSAADAAGWYCIRSGNDTPPLPKEFSYLEKHGGYYVDRAATSDDKRIYLTFDAGYENGNIARVLDVLKEKSATGCFFILEHMIECEPELVLRMKNEGHTVANHSATHPDMTRLSEAEFREQLLRVEDAYRCLCGEELSKFYRPPEGKLSEKSLINAEKMGYRTVMWSFAYADWDNENQPDPEASVKKILGNTHNGMIILLHPTSGTNAAILGRLIDEWRAAGYRFASLEELK